MGQRLVAAVIGAALIASVSVAAPVAARSGLAGSTHARGTVGHLGSHTFADAVRRAHSSEAALHRETAPRRLAAPAPTAKPRPAGAKPKVARTAVSPLVVVTDPQTTGFFDGTTENDLVSPLEPPSAFVAAGPTAIVETTNGMVRVFSRTGSTLASTPTWSFFGIPSPYTDASPRILYDAAHARWVASISVRYTDDSDDYVFFGISETSDPLGAWDIYYVSYADHIPDSPGLASSTDKIVITTNEFDSLGYVGASVFAITWASLLTGAFAYGFTDPDPELFSIRPARIVGSSADVHLIAEGEDTQAGHVMYEPFSGSALGATTANFIDLTTGGPGLAAFADDSTILAPRQTGGDTIADAVDGRPTDAVWRANNLWFVSTTTNGGGTIDDVRVTRIVTGVGTPTAGGDFVIETGGVDSYAGGVGVTGDGTPFATWTTSSPSDDPAAHFATISGDAVGTVEDLASSDGPYDGELWGDYVGVAADPQAAGAVWIVGETAAGDGTWRTDVVQAVVDSTAPSTPGVPDEYFVYPATLGDLVATGASWTASTDPGSGIAGYRVLTNETPPGLPATGFGSPTLRTTTSMTRSLVPRDTYAYQVQAIDGAGNLGLAATGAAFTPVVYATPTLSVTGTWSTWSSAAYLGGSSRWSATKNATATVSFTGRAFALETYVGPTRGSVNVYVDGVFTKTVSTYAVTAKALQIVYGRSWTVSGAHKVKFVIVGTAGHPHVDIDGLLVLR
jgi:hypothetical protein